MVGGTRIPWCHGNAQTYICCTLRSGQYWTLARLFYTSPSKDIEHSICMKNSSPTNIRELWTVITMMAQYRSPSCGILTKSSCTLLVVTYIILRTYLMNLGMSVYSTFCSSSLTKKPFLLAVGHSYHTQDCWHQHFLFSYEYICLKFQLCPVHHQLNDTGVFIPNDWLL